MEKRRLPRLPISEKRMPLTTSQKIILLSSEEIPPVTERERPLERRRPVRQAATVSCPQQAATVASSRHTATVAGPRRWRRWLGHGRRLVSDGGREEERKGAVENSESESREERIKKEGFPELQPSPSIF